MDKLILFLSSIDWVFMAVILIAGRYWGRKYFRIAKNPALNFLAFATVAAAIWLGIQAFMGTIKKEDTANLFLTYLFTTSFYELLAKRLFVAVEGFFGIKMDDQ